MYWWKIAKIKKKKLFPAKRVIRDTEKFLNDRWACIGYTNGRLSWKKCSSSCFHHEEMFLQPAFWNGNETNLRRRAVDFVLVSRSVRLTSVTSHRRRPANVERRSRLVIISTTKYSRESIFFLSFFFSFFNYLIHSIERMEYFFERNNNSFLLSPDKISQMLEFPENVQCLWLSPAESAGGIRRPSSVWGPLGGCWRDNLITRVRIGDQSAATRHITRDRFP